MKSKSESVTGSEILQFAWLGAFVGFLVGAVALAMGSRPTLPLAIFSSMVACIGIGSFVGCLAYFPAKVVFNEFAIRQMGREERLKSYFRYLKLRRKQIALRDQEQLNKADFDTRLNAFVTGSKAETVRDDNSETCSEWSPEENEEPYTSSMPYWQRNNFHVGKMPMPVDLIRSLIRRISIGVYKGRNGKKPAKSN